MRREGLERCCGGDVMDSLLGDSKIEGFHSARSKVRKAKTQRAKQGEYEGVRGRKTWQDREKR